MAQTYLDVLGAALVEGGNVLADESVLGLVGLCPGHSQQLSATLVLLQGLTVPPVDHTHTHTQYVPYALYIAIQKTRLQR